MAGITFSQIAGAGDALPNDRHVLYFPHLPNGVDGNTLTLRHLSVTLPPIEVGQIIVKTFGWSVAFAGRRNNPNTFNVSFFETTDAPVVKALASWQSAVAGFKQPTSKRKLEYAVQAKLVVSDTTGKSALTCMLLNVYPQNITTGGFEETSGAWQHDVTFSIDAMDIIGITSQELALSSLTNLDFTSPGPGPEQFSNVGVQPSFYDSPQTTTAWSDAKTYLSSLF